MSTQTTPAIETSPELIHTTREDWLQAAMALALERLAPMMRWSTGPMAQIRIACSWPFGGGRSRVSFDYASPALSVDGCHEIRISPRLDEPEEVLGAVMQGLSRAVGQHYRDDDSLGSASWGRWGRVRSLVRLGFRRGRLTTASGSTVAYRSWNDRAVRFVTWSATGDLVAGWLEGLGPYPHGRSTQGGANGQPVEEGSSVRRTQTTRMKKCECGICGWTVRGTVGRVVEQGSPVCPVCMVPAVVHPAKGDTYEPQAHLDGVSYDPAAIEALAILSRTERLGLFGGATPEGVDVFTLATVRQEEQARDCLLYTSDAADE